MYAWSFVLVVAPISFELASLIFNKFINISQFTAWGETLGYWETRHLRPPRCLLLFAWVHFRHCIYPVEWLHLRASSSVYKCEIICVYGIPAHTLACEITSYIQYICKRYSVYLIRIQLFFCRKCSDLEVVLCFLPLCFYFQICHFVIFYINIYYCNFIYAYNCSIYLMFWYISKILPD